MLVKDLLLRLQGVDPNLPVILEDSSGFSLDTVSSAGESRTPIEEDAIRPDLPGERDEKGTFWMKGFELFTTPLWPEKENETEIG